MSRLSKQWFTPRFPVTQLTKHKTKDLRMTYWSGFESKGFCKKICLHFHTTNRCHYLLVPFLVITVFPGVTFITVGVLEAADAQFQLVNRFRRVIFLGILQLTSVPSKILYVGGKASLPRQKKH